MFSSVCLSVSLTPFSCQGELQTSDPPYPFHWPRRSQAPAVPSLLLNTVFARKEIACVAHPSCSSATHFSCCTPSKGAGSSQQGTHRASSAPPAPRHAALGPERLCPSLRQSRAGCSEQGVTSAHLILRCLV